MILLDPAGEEVQLTVEERVAVLHYFVLLHHGRCPPLAVALLREGPEFAALDDRLWTWLLDT